MRGAILVGWVLITGTVVACDGTVLIDPAPLPDGSGGAATGDSTTSATGGARGVGGQGGTKTVTGVGGTVSGSGGGGSAGGGGTAGSGGGPTTGNGGAGGGTTGCAVQICSATENVEPCGDCVDNDRDGLVDDQDPECVNACDYAEWPCFQPWDQHCGTPGLPSCEPGQACLTGCCWMDA